jgi:uncharacterized membrane protein YadS
LHSVTSGWREFGLKEDWWAIWLGLGIMVVSYILFANGDLRTWAFIFCFLSIGLTTRIRDLAAAGIRPFAAFSAGVVVNVVLGFVLSVFVFASYWTNLAR